MIDGGYNGEIIIQEEEIIVRNWKKGKLKTKNLSKITTYIRWTRALSTISSRQKQSSASLKLRNYIFTKTWKLTIAISENKFKEIMWRFYEVWSWGITYSPKPGNWPLQYLKINARKLCRGSMLEIISLEKLYVSESRGIRELHEIINF